MPEAAERALISVATAYRYFSTAEDLWWEASAAAVDFHGAMTESYEQIDAVGTDPRARLETLIRSFGFWTIEDQIPSRQMAKFALDQWLRQADSPDAERVPNRQGRRNELIEQVLAPLRDSMSNNDIDRIAHALGLVVGIEAMIALTDAVGLDEPTAKQALLDASRWMLAGALDELTQDELTQEG
ncbi:MAG: hypothetical protein ACRDZQ_00145 [Acidimicrobiales bacterium]